MKPPHLGPHSHNLVQSCCRALQSAWWKDARLWPVGRNSLCGFVKGSCGRLEAPSMAFWGTAQTTSTTPKTVRPLASSLDLGCCDAPGPYCRRVLEACGARLFVWLCHGQLWSAGGPQQDFCGTAQTTSTTPRTVRPWDISLTGLQSWNQQGYLPCFYFRHCAFQRMKAERQGQPWGLGPQNAAFRQIQQKSRTAALTEPWHATPHGCAAACLEPGFTLQTALISSRCTCLHVRPPYSACLHALTRLLKLSSVAAAMTHVQHCAGYV